MTDPYNTATTHAPRPEAPADVPPVSRPAVRAPRQAARSNAPSERATLLPVVNMVVLFVILLFVGFKGGMRFGAFLFGCGPLVLAVAASLWISNPIFTTVVRWTNAALAAFVLFRLMRYISHGIFNGGMLLMLVTSVGVPAFNALFLKAKPAE